MGWGRISVPHSPSSKRSPSMLIIGIDSGGTFTDFICCASDTVSVHKVPSTPVHPDDQAIGQSRISVETCWCLEASVQGDLLLQR